MSSLFPSADWPSPNKDGHRYLLLDGAQCVHPKQVFEEKSLRPVRLFDGVLANGTADASVYLARLPETLALEGILQAVARVTSSFGAITFLDSSLSEDDLAQRLMRRLDARYAEGKSYTARYFDGRVLPLLMNALTPQQKEIFLALGQRWHYLAPERNWRALELTAPAKDPFIPPLNFNAEQWSQLIDDSYAYTLIDHFKLTDAELLAKVPEPDQYRFFRACVALADRYGIQEGGKILMVTTWALISGENYYQQPEWDQRLRDFAAGIRTARQIGNEAYPMEESWEE